MSITRATSLMLDPDLRPRRFRHGEIRNVLYSDVEYWELSTRFSNFDWLAFCTRKNNSITLTDLFVRRISPSLSVLWVFDIPGSTTVTTRRITLVRTSYLWPDILMITVARRILLTFLTLSSSQVTSLCATDTETNCGRRVVVGVYMYTVRWSNN
jgi:hypothetical protein